MSAAAPLPPQGPPTTHIMNGYTNGYSNGADRQGDGDGAGDPRGPGGSYPPIAEIVGAATEKAESLKHHTVHSRLVLPLLGLLISR
jgi:ubiquitin carboxyl-terminal hydrolase 8